MLVQSGFGDSFDSVNYDDSENILGVIYLGSSLMWNEATICGGRIYFKIFLSNLSEIWKSLDSKYAIMFLVTFL